MRHAFIALTGITLVSLVGLAATAQTVSSTRRAKHESGCRIGCLRAGGNPQYCTPYCACVGREVFTGRSEQEIDALYAVMRPDAPEGPAKNQLQALMDRCIQEADKADKAAKR